MVLFTCLFILAYPLGSINFSILLFRFLGRGDPRSSFSKNPGATNVYRQLGLGWAALVLFLDMGRAAGLAAAGLLTAPVAWLPLLSAPLILGNRFPLFHQFRGGKGVANFLGFTAVLAPEAAVIACLAWVIFYKISKAPFIGSFFMISILGLGLLARCGPGVPSLAGTIITLGLIFQAHRGNISEWKKKRGRKADETA